MTGADGRRPLSLRSRVALTGVAVLAGWVVILTVVMNVVVGSQLRSQAHDAVRVRAQAAASTVVISPSGAVSIRDSGQDAALDVGTWILAGSTVIEHPRGGSGLEPQAALLSGAGQQLVEVDGNLWYAEPVDAGGEQVATVVTSLSLEPYRATEQLLRAGTAVLAVLLLASVWIALRVGVGRALRPVAEMTHQSARWSTDDVDRRFGSARRPAELDDLAATLDGLLDRLSAVLRHEQHLSSEISHELRTPLARLLAEVELQRDRLELGSATDASLAVIASSASEMSEILETLMTAARSASGTAPGRCDAVAVLADLVGARDLKGRHVRMVAAGPVTVGVGDAVLGRAVSPVLDNALRYARTNVELTITPGRSAVTIEVTDDGPGINRADLPHVFDPGRRGSSADGHPGAGLGLALSRRLLTAVGGSIQATNGESGACFTIRVPAA